MAKLRRLGVGPGQQVLVYGASGSVGTAAVQLARVMGAEVTAVCGTGNIELVRSLGAARVIDYTRENVAEGDARYDAILDAVGRLPFGRCHSLLRAGGAYSSTDGWSNLFWLVANRVKGRKRVVFATPRHRKPDVMHLRELIDAGAYRPVIDSTYQLEEVVEAARYVETGLKTGNVVITVSS